MEMKKPFLIFLILTALLSLSGVKAAAAQSAPEFGIRLQRNFGYGGFNNEIQGFFQIKLTGPLEQVKEVSYKLDETEIGAVSESPFKLDFNTENYQTGEHSLSATVRLLDLSEVHTEAVRIRIISKQDAMALTFKLVGGILALTAVALLFSFLLTRRSRAYVPGQAQNYNGLLGGAICPKCGHPFPRSLIGVKVGLARFEPCPSCGKWVTSRSASQAELEAAEKAEAEKYQSASSMPSVEELDKRFAEKAVDDTRYLDE